ncbi:Bug family tripartite tricarboxylate transporter substrate binding protein [Azospirillum sp. ST 5-10]|uniref:Bug family tripartite tricarboxylate transporter substrate binding protein n=1 Tax=unclassified Azospirillum TaxID=2630922 RepID=UPI003F49E138
MLKRWTRFAAVVVGMAGAVPAATAFAFPDRPVTIVVPFAAGGGTDITTRAMQEPMAKALGTEVVVKNVAGAGGVSGVAEAVRARADGYTLAMAPVGPLTTQPHLRKLPYDLDSFDYVCLAYSAPSVFAVRRDAPYSTLGELVAYAKANPGKLNFAVQAIGSIPHVAGLALAHGAQIQLTYLPVNGDGPAYKALLDGTADVFVPHVSFLSKNKEQIKGLAVLQAARLADLPDLPTAKEQGFDIEAPIWGGLVAPKGIPADAKAALGAACKAATAADSFRKLMDDLAQPVAFMDGAAFSGYVRRQWERNRYLLESAGLKAE